MQIHVTDADGLPLYVQVVNQIKLLVSSGRLATGDQLPPVRKLAEQLLINPNTVARAYRELETLGVVSTRRGAGVFVAESGSPFSSKEKRRILQERIDGLLTESRQLEVDLDTLVRLIRQRDQKLRPSQGE